MNTKEKTMLGYTPDEYKKFKKYAWRYLIMFSIMYCCFYCMRLNITNAGPAMQEQMGWTKTQFGMITGTLTLTYGFGHLFNGRLSEIVGPNKFVIASVILSFIANICMGFANSIWVMMIIWGFNGYFQSMAWTPGLATITKWWPGSHRGFAAGFAHAFSAFGQTLVTLVVLFSFWLSDSFISPKLNLDLGWKVAFFIPPLIPILMLIVYVIVAKASPTKIGLKEYVEEDKEKNAEEEEMKKVLKTKGPLYPYFHVLSNKKFLFWVFVAFLTGIARYGLVTWIPNFFKDAWNFKDTTAILMSLPLTLGMAAGTLTVPSLTDKFCPTNRLPAVVLSALVSGAAVPFFLLLNSTNIVHIVIIEILLFISGFGIYAINGLAFAMATEVGGRVFGGTCSGIMDFSLYMGATAQAVVYGTVLDLFSNNYNAVFITISLFCILIAGVAFLGSKKSKKA